MNLNVIESFVRNNLIKNYRIVGKTLIINDACTVNNLSTNVRFNVNWGEALVSVTPNSIKNLDSKSYGVFLIFKKGIYNLKDFILPDKTLMLFRKGCEFSNMNIDLTKYRPAIVYVGSKLQIEGCVFNNCNFKGDKGIVFKNCILNNCLISNDDTGFYNCSIGTFRIEALKSSRGYGKHFYYLYKSTVDKIDIIGKVSLKTCNAFIQTLVENGVIIR